MTTFKNYYAVLEIENFANIDLIKKAYRSQAIKFHPDKNHSINAHDKFIEINEAYNILIDQTKKSIYDEILRHQLFKVYETNEDGLNEKREMVKDWILFERSKMFEKWNEKTDKGLTETFNFLDHYGMGIIVIFVIIIFIAAMTFNK
jgi:DnaJ-class molecular chaperone